MPKGDKLQPLSDEELMQPQERAPRDDPLSDAEVMQPPSGPKSVAFRCAGHAAEGRICFTTDAKQGHRSPPKRNLSENATADA
jgi:hypothetical protein